MTTTKPTAAIAATSAASPATALRAWLLWTAGFLAFPIAGVAGIAAAGRVDSPIPALLGGLATGAVLGLGQALVSSRRLPTLRWAAATALGMGAGLALGAHTVSYHTTMGDLAVMGALTGVALGLAQALALPEQARARWLWALAMPGLWAAGWAISTLVIGASVDNQFTVFGASGAATVTGLLGILLHVLLPIPKATPSVPATDATPAPNTPSTGDQS
jgi:hypothetical protein